MKRFYTAKTDRVFKAIFCRDETKHMMMKLLSSVLERNVTDLTFLTNELPIDNVSERQKIVDVLANVDGEYIHIELNSNAVNYLHFRNFIYFSEIYSKKTKRGEKYDFKIKFIHIDLTYGLKSDDDVIKYYVMSNTGKRYINNLEIIEFNMDKLKNYCYNKSSKEYEKYKYLIMLDMSEYELEESVVGDEFMEEYKNRLKDLNEDETFTSAISYEDDQRYILNTEKWMSFEEGMEKGMEKGIEQGKLEGIQEGERKIQKNKETIIKNMYKQDMSIEQIANIVEIPVGKVKEILDKGC